ncbi:replication protein [Sporosarcina sp. PTS2304]|uniref:conserved phage C-terminal domain-containing protein n=1 Tax=Sporosarcina sp. PTS2304 TaxID=2283194 RepID=UPI000E0CD0ED|nr:conserved phage C-terminal domain-containing protein [Sporosarcina sp. PTS2304]AXH98900.1 replication protein [Sporosarcina sp. PTS2304]
MKLLIDENPLQLLPSLVHQVGMNGAVFLQQLHFRSLVSKNIREGHKWVYNTYEEWTEEFTFWSPTTIRRIIYDLEKKEILLSTSSYNKMKIDNTKWYRIDYSKIHCCAVAKEQMVHSQWTSAPVTSEQVDLSITDKPITKELKINKNKDIVETNLDAVQHIINYLNEKAYKQFKANTVATKKEVNARIAEGYTIDDFKRVIDHKVSQWLNDSKFRSYLRPSTLFHPINFENYLNECLDVKPVVSRRPLRPPVLDFTRGER